MTLACRVPAKGVEAARACYKAERPNLIILQYRAVSSGFSARDDESGE